MASPVSNRSTPETILNRPALHALAYRVGTFASFRQTMLESISTYVRTPAKEAREADSHPLKGWTTRATDDFGIAFIEMWAYLGDVLTFYQERIANEAYLRTAVEPESTNNLVSLIGYRPAPGRAAQTYLTFEAEKQSTVRLDPSLLVQSVPGQGEKPQKFETTEAITAHASLNTLRPRTLEKQELPFGSRRAVLAGVGHDISPGDWIAIVDDKRRTSPTSERWDVRQVTAAFESNGTTTVTWEKGLGKAARGPRPAITPAQKPEFWVFRNQAWLFGHNAPDYNLFALPLSLKNKEIVEKFRAAFPDWSNEHLPEDDNHPDQIYLDTVYPNVVAGGWTALVGGDNQYVELYPVKETVDTAWQNYTLSAKVTRMTVDTVEAGEDKGKPENIDIFPIRGTIALIQSEQIALAEVPIGHSAINPDGDRPDPVNGNTIELDAVYADLQRGRTLLVTGITVSVDNLPTGEAVEAVTVARVTHGAARTTVVVTAPLKHSYDRASVLIYGNVANATHGETIADEAIGDGDAAREFQAFAVKKSPVTFVSQPGASGGVATTLTIRVDGVRWKEVAELYGQMGDARVYMTRRNPDGMMWAQFGDGRTGARLVSGRKNVRATYRIGLGPEGNVEAESLKTLLKKPLGLKRVTNRAATAGGISPESALTTKQNAPGTVRTFGRIVSLQDFEDAAREYVGIAKARATWRWDGERRLVELVVGGDGGASVESIMGDLQADLDLRRNPHQPLRIADFKRMPVTVVVNIVVDDAHTIDTVKGAVEQALRTLFAFDALEFGRSIHLSDLHEAIQPVEGIVAVDVEEFRFKHPPDRIGRGGAMVQPRLLIAPNEMAWVEDSEDLRIAGAHFRSEEQS